MFKTTRVLIFVFLMVFACASISFAEIYKWTDDDGKLHYTDKFYSVPEKFRQEKNKPARSKSSATQAIRGEKPAPGPGAKKPGAEKDVTGPAIEGKIESYKNPNLKTGINDNDIIGWSVTISKNAIYSTGAVYVGEGLLEGLTRKQTGERKHGTYSRYVLSVKGGNLKNAVSKTLPAKKVGKNSWKDVLLVSNLAPGKYEVSLLPEILYIKKDGTPTMISGPHHYMKISY